MERSVLKMPAVALRGLTILPGMITHFDVSRSRSAKAVERSVAQDQKLFVVTQKDPETENPDLSVSLQTISDPAPQSAPLLSQIWNG